MSIDRYPAFYTAFEARFRGSRDAIRTRLLAYVPFLDAILAAGGRAHALDLGCGRGEWLELLGEKGFAARGVDLDDHMLDSCRQLGLDARQGDAIAELNSLPDESLSLVSAFHLVEHLPFEQLQTLVAEAHRVLKPGGLLIMETPNPENINVSTLTFHLDPTHRKPLPPQLLKFLADFFGFHRSIEVRLQEDPNLAASTEATIGQVLTGVSPDYAIVAQKTGDPHQLEPADRPFAGSYGLTREVLAARFQSVVDAGPRIAALEARNAELAAGLERLGSELADGLQRQGAEWQAMSARLESALQAVHASTSWKVTAPLRALVLNLRWLRDGAKAWLTLRPGSRPRRVARQAVNAGVGYLMRHPRQRLLVLRLTAMVPPLQGLLLRFAAPTLQQLRRPKDIDERAWYLEPDPDAVAGWEKAFNSGLKDGSKS